MKKLNLIIQIITFILAIAFIYMVLLKLTNHSPTMDAVIIACIGICIGFQFSLNTKINYNSGKFNVFMKQFAALASDFKILKKEFSQLTGDVAALKQDFRKQFTPHKK